MSPTSSIAPRPLLRLELLVAAIAAVALPTLLAYNLSPSPTFLNQAVALAGFGMLLVACGGAWSGDLTRCAAPLLGALAVLATLALGGWSFGSWPGTLAGSALGLIVAAAVVALAGALAGQHRALDGERGGVLFAAFAGAWVVAGVLNLVVALIQVFAPAVPDGNWIAASGIAGRAVGNLRQPNHLSSVFTLAAVAVAGLVALRAVPASWSTRRVHAVAAALLAGMVFGIVLTASRTGLLSVFLLALWGVVDRRLARPLRGLLIATPLMYAAAWGAMALWAQLGEHTFGGAERLAESDITSSRVGIWLNTLALIRQEPWLGVGFGQFNLAWSLTPFPGRPNAFFDHTHNLPLQLAVEIGLPLAALVCGLLVWALVRAARSPLGAAPMMVAMAGLHSLLEYPLWYAYFLLPTAWVWGWALGAAGPGRKAELAPSNSNGGGGGVVALAGLVLVAAALLSTWDYFRVVRIFKAPPGAPPLAERVAEGRNSWFFGHHADYAAVTSGLLTGPAAAPAFERASHYLLDTRLAMAWARWLESQGRRDEARHLALRLREFRRPESASLFAECPVPRPAAIADPPPGSFACDAPSRVVPWREFTRQAQKEP